MIDSATIHEAVDLLECAGWKGYARAVREQAEQLVQAEAQRDAAEARCREYGQHQWQPIETAPKDGTEILVRCQNRAGLPGTVVAHFCSAVEDHPPIDATFYFWNGIRFNHVTKPTHWMPLPADPPLADPVPIARVGITPMPGGHMAAVERIKKLFVEVPLTDVEQLEATADPPLAEGVIRQEEEKE